MTITAIARNFDGNPNIVSIVTDDVLATITGAGYWTAQKLNIEALQNGDFQWADTDIVLMCYGPGFLVNWFVYDVTTDTFVANPAAGGLSNSLPSGDIFVGNVSNVATGVAMSGAATISNTGVVTLAAAAVTSAKVDPTLIQYAEVDFTAAQWNGMYAAPRQLVAAPGANKLIVVDRVVLDMTFVSAQFTAGGAVAAQYDSTVHGAGALASATVAAATVNGYAASTADMLAGALSSVLFTACVNKGIFLSNDTAAFATGDSTWKVQIWYHIVATV